MTGVVTTVYVLSFFSCFGGLACLGATETQWVRLTSQQACNSMKEALERYPGPERFVVAECYGEARELSRQELDDAGFTPTHR